MKSLLSLTICLLLVPGSRNPDGSATPKWVLDAIARKHEMALTLEMAISGTAELKITPVFDDPMFLQKLRNFLQALAQRYDGEPGAHLAGGARQMHRRTNPRITKSDPFRLRRGNRQADQ